MIPGTNSSFTDIPQEVMFVVFRVEVFHSAATRWVKTLCFDKTDIQTRFLQTTCLRSGGDKTVSLNKTKVETHSCACRGPRDGDKTDSTDFSPLYQQLHRRIHHVALLAFEHRPQSWNIITMKARSITLRDHNLYSHTSFALLVKRVVHSSCWRKWETKSPKQTRRAP